MMTVDKKPRISNLKSASIDILLSNWYDLPTEVVQLILKKLPFVDLLRFKSVSLSSMLLQNSYLSSPHYSPVPQTPWLMLPSDQEDDSYSRCFFSLAEKKVYKINNVFEGFHNVFQGIGDCVRCVGSSYGWLIISDENENPSLLNPFSGAKIELPSTLTESLVYPYPLKVIKSSKSVRIDKAFLTSDPSRTQNFKVVMLYRTYRLAFYKHEENAWTAMEMGTKKSYLDIAYHNGLLYASTSRTLEVWNFDNPFPTKVSRFEYSMPPLRWKIGKHDYEYLTYNSYLVESLGELFYMFLQTSYFKGSTNRRYQFYIFKFNFSESRFEEQDTLLGRSFFVDKDQILAVCARDFPECEENSIYLAHGGFGLCKLQRNNVMEPFCEWGKSKNMSPPFWIVPNI